MDLEMSAAAVVTAVDFALPNDFLTYLSLLIGIAGGIWTVLKVRRDSKEASETTALSGFSDLVTALQGDLTATRIEMKALRVELIATQERVRVLEFQNSADQGFIARLLRHMHYLREFIREHLPDAVIEPLPQHESHGDENDYREKR